MGGIVGDIVDGIVDFVDDVLGIELDNILDNDLVKGSLLAASLFTGGVAIVNGVVQGAGAAAGAKGFLAKFSAGAPEFFKGVASGLANPLDTSKDLVGKITNATQATGQAGTAGASVLDTAPDSLDVLAGGAEESVSSAVNLPGETVSGAATPDISFESLSNQDALQSAQDALKIDPQAASTVNNGDLISGTLDASTLSAPSSSPINIGQVGEEGFFSKMAGGVKDFAKSGIGQQVISGAIQGYANARQQEEFLRERRRERERRAASFRGFADRASSDLSGSRALSQLRDRSQRLMQRGEQAQESYGF